jgi:hypothetical protein
LSLDVHVVEARLPSADAHAGAARRAAMDLAEAWLVEAGEKDGVILTTDADSQVAPNWIAENLAAFAAGAEAVLGRIDLDEEGAYLPEALHRRGELEDTYEKLLTELSWLLDPLYHNPWRDPGNLLPRRASSSRAAGGGQGADRIAVAPGCTNSLLLDRPRDHVGSNTWARAGRRRGHPCHPKHGARRVL